MGGQLYDQMKSAPAIIIFEGDSLNMKDASATTIRLEIYQDLFSEHWRRMLRP